MTLPTTYIKNMSLVIVESPYAGDIERNLEYAKAAVRDCLSRGEAPICSHLLFTQPGILDDNLECERDLGISAGLAWARACNIAAFYTDCGMSIGMTKALKYYCDLGVNIEMRLLKGSWNKS